MNLIFIIFWFLVAVLLLLYYVSTKEFNYWKKKKVPYATPAPLFGNYLKFILLQKCQAHVSQELCQKFRNEPYFGTFFGTEPALMILDPEIIKLVTTKDFYYFNSRELMDYIHKEVVTQNLFFQFGDKWKVVRSNLTPLFTTAKLKNMFYLVEKCCCALENMLNHEVNASASKVLEVRTLMIRFTMDVIISCGFGMESGTMAQNAEQNPFTIMGKLILGSSISRGFKNSTRQMWPYLFYAFGFMSFPKEINTFFHKLITDVFKSRGYEPTKRNDFVDLLLALKKNGAIVGDSIRNMKTGGSEKVELELDDALMVAQCVVIFGAGFETSAAAVSLTIYELAKNQKAQKRAQKEIDDYLKKNDNKLGYDCVKELPFLEACMYETLRLYPVLPVLTRETVEGYTFPSGLHLERGTRVHLPVYHLHRDPQHFPDPEEYKPERHLPDAEHTINPYTFFPYGEGPRICVGMRLSKMVVLPGLVTFLKTYNVEPAAETPLKLVFETTTLLLQPTSNLPVKVTRREGWKERSYTS